VRHCSSLRWQPLSEPPKQQLCPYVVALFVATPQPLCYISMPSESYGGPRPSIPKLNGQILFKTAAVRKGEEDLCFPNVYGSDGDAQTHTYCSNPSFPKKPYKPSSANGRPRTSPAVSSSQVFGNAVDMWGMDPHRPTDSMMSSSARKTESPRKRMGMRKKPPHALPHLPNDGSSNNSRPQSAPAKSKKQKGTKTMEDIDEILNTAREAKTKPTGSDDHFEYNVWKVLAVVDFRRTVPPRPLFEVKDNAAQREAFQAERAEVVMYCLKFGTALSDCLDCFSRMCKDKYQKPDPSLSVDEQIRIEQDQIQKAQVAKIKVAQVKAWQSRLKGDKCVNQAQAFLTGKDIKGAWAATERAAKGFNGYAKSKHFQGMQNSAGYTLDEKSDDSYRFKCAVALMKHLFPQFVRLSTTDADQARTDGNFLTGYENASAIIKAFSFMAKFSVDFTDLALITKAKLEPVVEPVQDLLPIAIEMRDWTRAALDATRECARMALDSAYFAADIAEQSRVAAAKLSAKDAARIAAEATYQADLYVATASAKTFALVVYRDASGFTAAADAEAFKFRCFDNAKIFTAVANVNVTMQLLFRVYRAETAAAEARVAMIRTFWIATTAVRVAQARVDFMQCVRVANSFAKAANLRLAVVVCDRVAKARVAREEENYKEGLDKLEILEAEATMTRFSEMQNIHNNMLPKDGHKKIVSYFSECQEEQPNSALMSQIPQRMVVNLCLANGRFIHSAKSLRQWLRHALLADLLASRVCYWSVKETELRLVALDSQMSVMYTIKEARMRVFVAQAKCQSIISAKCAEEEVARANANAAKNFCHTVERARENRRNLQYKAGLDELYSLDPPLIQGKFKEMQQKLDEFPVPLAIQYSDDDLKFNLGDDFYLEEVQTLREWLETAQKAEKDACLVAFQAYAGAWRETARSVAIIARIQADGAAAAALIAQGVAQVAYDKALREFKAAQQYQKIFRAQQGRRAFKRRKAAVAAENATKIARWAEAWADFHDLITDARIGSIFCQDYARARIASACIKRCALTCKGAEISAKRSQRFALRMQLKAESEFDACQCIQRIVRGVYSRVYVREAVKAKACAVAAAEQACGVVMVLKMQAVARAARVTAKARQPHASNKAIKMARRAAAGSMMAAILAKMSVVEVKARMRSQLGTKESWIAASAAMAAASTARCCSEMASLATENSTARAEQETGEREALEEESKNADDEMKQQREEEEAEEEASVAQKDKSREPFEATAGALKAEYDELKAEQDQLFANKKKSKAKKLEKRVKPAKDAYDEAHGVLTGMENEHAEEREERVAGMLEERTEREDHAKAVQADRNRQLNDLSQTAQSRLAAEFPEEQKEEVLPGVEEVRLEKELEQRINSEKDRLATIRADLDKMRVSFVMKQMQDEYKVKIDKIWEGDAPRRGYASIKLSMAAMSMQKVIRAHQDRKLVMLKIAQKKQEEMEGWMDE